MIKSKQLIFSTSRRCPMVMTEDSQPRTLKAQTPCRVEHFSFHLDQSTEQKKLQKFLTNPFKWTLLPDQAQSPKKTRYQDIKFMARVILLILQQILYFSFSELTILTSSCCPVKTTWTAVLVPRRRRCSRRRRTNTRRLFRRLSQRFTHISSGSSLEVYLFFGILQHWTITSSVKNSEICKKMAHGLYTM